MSEDTAGRAGSVGSVGTQARAAAGHTHDGPAQPALEHLPEYPGIALSADFLAALPELAIEWRAAVAPDPQVLMLNDALARELGLNPAELRAAAGAEFLVGRALAEGSRPVAQLYAGHQFGGYSPLLGDGRALLLGELRDRSGAVRDLHLKGSGPTPPARGDGFAAVGPMLREYLVSEAMHALGIPTTRALAVTATGRSIWRDDFRRDNRLPGAVLARVAASHLRVGSFQLARARRDAGLLQRLVRFAIHRHAPQLAASTTPALELLREVVRRQAELVAAWMLVGFVHGVMNTDNMTISGETIDYGPCAFLDAYDPQAVFSSIDHEGRYAFANQRPIAKWNLARFAESLLPAIVAEGGSALPGGGEPAGGGDDAALEVAVATASAALAEFDAHFDAAWIAGMRAKLGLADAAADDVAVAELARDLLQHLRDTRADHTGSFRALAAVAAGSPGPADAEFAPPADWLSRWLAYAPDAAAMNRVNPIYIPRNHLLDAALEAATDGDLAPFERLLNLVTHPFDEQPGADAYALPAPPGAGRFVTYCGT